MIGKIQKNLSKNMLFYTLVAMVSGMLIGYHFPEAKSLSTLILPVVFVMIYPMMVNISLSSLRKTKGSVKPLLEGLALNFLYAPILIYFLSSLFITDPRIRLALMLLSIAPASSMGLGYLGLAEGHMVTGAMIVASAFILSIFIYPTAGSYFAAESNIAVPMNLLLKNLFLILILPLAFGIMTREYIERKHKKGTFVRVKPYFSTVTLMFLYILIFIIFVSKASLIVKNYTDVILITPVALIFYGVTILLTLFLNSRMIGMGYGYHQSVVFTSISKNVALTIAVLVSVFGKEGGFMAVAPAIVSLFQAPILMIYLKQAPRVRRYFGSARIKKKSLELYEIERKE